MIRKITGAILMITLFYCCSGDFNSNKKADEINDHWISSIKSNYNQIYQFAMLRDSIEKIGISENETLFNLFQAYDDSVFLINNKLLSEILKLDNGKFDFKSGNVSLDSIGLITLGSDDANFNIIAWDTYMGGNIPSYISIIIYKSEGKPFAEILSTPNGIGKKKTGDNLLPYKVVEIHSNGSKMYVLLSENKCGNICMTKKAKAYEIKSGAISQVIQPFKDAKSAYTDLSFAFYISDKVIIDPDFHIDTKRKEIFTPEYVNDNGEVILKQKYEILLKD